MGRRTWGAGAVLAIAAGLVLGAPASAPAQEAPRVLIVDNEPDLTRWHYAPADITVPAGTTVVWFNKGKEEHSVTADDKSFDSGLKKTGGTFSRVFSQPGKYSYYCQPHPWMKGTVEVTPAARTAAAAAPTPTTAAPPATTTTAAAAPTTSAPAGAGAEAQDAPAPTEQTPETDQGSEDETAAPASNDDGSGRNLAGTLAVVLLPTLGALALGAKLRQAQS